MPERSAPLKTVATGTRPIQDPAIEQSAARTDPEPTSPAVQEPKNEPAAAKPSGDNTPGAAAVATSGSEKNWAARGRSEVVQHDPESSPIGSRQPSQLDAPEQRSASEGPSATDSTAHREPEDRQRNWQEMTHLGELSSAEYPYLQERMPNKREDEAILGPMPMTDAQLGTNPDGRVEPSADDELQTFSGDVRPATLQGDKDYFRVVGDGSQAAGSYWTDTPPADNSAVRRELAVKNDWSGGGGLERFRPSHDIATGWEGTVAPQAATVGPGYLQGGGRQIWVPATSLTLGDGSWHIDRLDVDASRGPAGTTGGDDDER